MNGSCLNNSYVQNCTQPKADGCQWDERCVSWNYMNCTQVSYYQNCLNNMTKPTVESQVKRSKMRAFTLNPSDRRPVQVVAQEPNCAPCFNMGVRVKDLIEQHNCNFIFETYMQTLAEEFFPSEQASGEIAAKFVSNCAHLREHVEKGTYTPQYACQRASAC